MELNGGLRYIDGVGGEKISQEEGDNRLSPSSVMLWMCGSS
jgi:hypothetical protein